MARAELLFPLALGALGIAVFIAFQKAQTATVYDSGGADDYGIDPAPMSPATSFYGGNYMSPSNMRTSDRTLLKIQGFEGRRNSAYQDGTGNWTIGIGHLIKYRDGLLPDTAFTIGTDGFFYLTDFAAARALTITDAQVDMLYSLDIADAENSVRSRVTAPLTQGQFDGLVEFIFNLGDNNFKTSTLLRKINARDYAGAAAEFDRWVHDGGKVVAALVTRRAYDKSLFMAG